MAIFFTGSNISLSEIVNLTGSSYSFADDEMLTSAKDYIVLVDTSQGNANIKLPNANSLANSMIFIKDVAASASVNNIVLTASSGETFTDNNSQYYTLSTDADSYVLRVGSIASLNPINYISAYLEFTDYGELSSSLIANTGTLHVLKNKTSGLRIGTWEYDTNSSGSIPIGIINLGNVSDSQVAWQSGSSATTGLTRTLQAGHNMPSSGLVTLWSITGSSEIATSVSFTLAGNTITFASDPGQTLTNDVFHVEGVVEFGELRETGYWIPKNGSFAPYWSSGLTAYMISGSGYVVLPWAKMPESTIPQYYHTWSEFTFTTASNTNGNFIGFGYLSTDEATLAGMRNDGSQWIRAIAKGQAITTPAITWTNGGNLGSNIDNQTIWMGFTSTPSDASDVQYSAYTVSGSESGLTAGNGVVGSAELATNVGQNTDGPITDFILGANGENLVFTIKKIRYMVH